MSKRGTLRGAAAGAFIRAVRNDPPADELEEYRRLATLVHMEVADGRLERAAAAIKSIVDAKIAATAAPPAETA